EGTPRDHGVELMAAFEHPEVDVIEKYLVVHLIDHQVNGLDTDHRKQRPPPDPAWRNEISDNAHAARYQRILRLDERDDGKKIGHCVPIPKICGKKIAEKIPDLYRDQQNPLGSRANIGDTQSTLRFRGRFFLVGVFLGNRINLANHQISASAW